MNKLKDTFGINIHHFGLTIDIVDDKTFQTIWGLIETYLKKHLDINSISLKVETSVDRKPGLITIKGPDEGTPSFTLYSDKEEPTGQTAYAYVNRKNLWIVDANKGLLNAKDSQHIDLWEKLTGFPHTPKHKSPESRTSILIPIERRERTAGVVEFESHIFVEPTDGAKEELLRISETISRMNRLHDLHKSQNKSTERAVSRLSDMLTEKDWPPLKMPKLFVSYPGNSNSDVIGAMKKVLSEFSEDLEAVDWKSINDSGNINFHLLENISKSAYGLCYFSEPVPPESRKDFDYQDNANVIFEAGMFQALTNSPSSQPIGWIPIRETSSPPTPFDFASDRFIMIDRLSNGEMNVDAFYDTLRKRIQNLIG